ELTPYILRLRNAELARQALAAARLQYQAARDEQVAALRREAAAARQELQALQQQDLHAILDRLFKRAGAGAEVPPGGGIALAPLLEKRRYPWDARQLLAEAEKYFASRGEAAAWKAAQKEGTAEAYRAYLADRPDGPYAARARERIDDLEWERARTADDAEA